MNYRPRIACVAVLLGGTVPGVLLAQTTQVRVHVHHHDRPLAANIVIPQRTVVASVPAPGATVVRVDRVQATVAIVEQVATTTLTIILTNPSAQRLEAEIVLPVPERAAVRGFDFQGAGHEPSAELLSREDARRIYDSIVSRTRDPALLEFVGYNLIRSSVFPVEPGGTQRVRLTYEHVCPADGDRVDYILPRSESLDYRVPWEIAVTVRSQSAISAVYSPSHAIEQHVEKGGHRIRARLTRAQELEPGPFRLSLLSAQRDGAAATLLAYPDPRVGGGYFLLLAGLPNHSPQDRSRIRREVTLVLDRSGSMHGEKLEQVREAALQVIGGLEPDESFNIIVYNEAVDVFSERPVAKSEAKVAAARGYLHGVLPRGGTNIHDALVEALRQKPTPDRLPIVLLVTDGRPTIGQTHEKLIRDAVKAANTYRKRIFTIGVGVDVNSPLLEHIACDSRATATFVLPREDVENKIAQVFKRLSGPALAEPTLRVLDSTGEPAAGRTRDLIPAELPDIFDGDQILVLGQYVGDQPLTLRLSGNYRGTNRGFQFRFGLDKASSRNSFVPRLWAQRKIAVLIDAIRASGADSISANRSDPRLRELVDEVVRLSKEFGILSEYTAFLAREGTDLSRPEQISAEAWRNFDRRALQTRFGLDSLNQELNNAAGKSAGQLNSRNRYWDANMNEVQIASVQQVADQAFYRQENRWVDSRLAGRAERVQPQRIVEFGSSEFMQLAHRLASEDRQGSIMMSGEILLLVDGQPVLVRNR